MSKRIVQVDEKLPFWKGLPLSLQHLFAMFGASVLVPFLFGVEPGIVLLMNGIGTLLFLFICKGKSPAFLGSSFAFLSSAGLVIKSFGGYEAALGGFVVTGLIFALVAISIKFVGIKWIDVVFPKAAMGAIVAVIGLELAPTAAKMTGFVQDSTDPGLFMNPKVMAVAVITLAIVVLGSVAFRGFLSVIPILVGVIGGYIAAFILGIVNYGTIFDASYLAIPTVTLPVFNPTAILIIIPASLVVIAEHIGHQIVTSNVVGKDLIKDPGLHRSLLSDGISTALSGMVGAVPTTTYGENIGVMAITRVYSVWVIGGAAVLSIIMAFIGKLTVAIQTIPKPVMGGVSLMLFGVIAASGIRILVESKVDYSKAKNLVLTSVVLIIGLSGAQVTIGNLTLVGMSLATVVSIIVSLLFTVLEKLKLVNE